MIDFTSDFLFIFSPPSFSFHYHLLKWFISAETVDNIFMVGHEGLLHLMRNGPRQVQADMTAVFACLLKKGIHSHPPPPFFCQFLLIFSIR